MPRSEQSEQALRRANKIRLARAQAKRDVRAGRKSIEQALRLSCVQSMKVWDLLCAQYRWGEHKARMVMESAGVGAHCLVGDLTKRQRTLIAHPPVVEHAAPSLETPAPARSVMSCRACGVRLRERTREGICGFCLAEGAGVLIGERCP